MLRRVAELQVVAGAGRVLLGAVGAAHGLDLAAEGLEGGVDAGVRLVLVVRGRLVFRELGQGVWHALVVVAQDVAQGGCEVAGGSRGAWWPRLARRALEGRNVGETRTRLLASVSRRAHVTAGTHAQGGTAHTGLVALGPGVAPFNLMAPPAAWHPEGETMWSYLPGHMPASRHLSYSETQAPGLRADVCLGDATYFMEIMQTRTRVSRRLGASHTAVSPQTPMANSMELGAPVLCGYTSVPSKCPQQAPTDNWPRLSNSRKAGRSFKCPNQRVDQSSAS